jgi:transposase
MAILLLSFSPTPSTKTGQLLIEQQHGVRYDASQVWRILRKLNWSCQRTGARARRGRHPALEEGALAPA